MKTVENKFGVGSLYELEDLNGKIYVLGCACTSIQAEMLSVANSYKERFTKDPNDACNIIVLSCQVTDLAIYNDLENMKRLMKEYSNKTYFIGGCLARRFDIEMPTNVLRLDHIKVDYQNINQMNLIDYAPPFWVKNFKEGGRETEDGQLFRNMYPLRIGSGCKGRCKYCSIRITRGEPYTLRTTALISEFLNHEDVVLISDSPTIQQIIDWCEVALRWNKPISIRNVEPHVAVAVFPNLKELSQKRLLRILHVPIQSTEREVLEDMGRNVDATMFIINNINLLRDNTIVATNVIVDYKEFKNPNSEIMKRFDYWSWNPYWDGKWDQRLAQERFKKYFE